MRSDLGRFFEDHMLEVVNVMKCVYDAAMGAGQDVTVWIDGREMVFGKGEEGAGRGFMRMIPGEVSVRVAFPSGGDLPDPLKRTSGPRGSQTSVTLHHPSDLDAYMRRLVDAAYSL